MDVIAQRLLMVSRDGRQEEIRIQIGRPQLFRGTDYSCAYQITGAGVSKVKYAVGTDAIQALQLVMPMIGVDLATLNAAFDSSIRWPSGEPLDGHLGFPITVEKTA